MKRVVCQHCPELIEFIHEAWRTVSTLHSRAGSTHCPGLPALPHKPMPEVNGHA